ncbi:MAG: hypothetical protein AABX74_03325, partial [Nanoarchaeota archaeon]
IGVFEDIGARRIRGLKPEILNIQTNVDENIVKKIAAQVAKELGKNIKVDNLNIASLIAQQKEKVKIKTDYDFPIEDESIGLKSNIDKIGAKLEKEKSDIEKSVGLLKNIKKGR